MNVSKYKLETLKNQYNFHHINYGYKGLKWNAESPEVVNILKYKLQKRSKSKVGTVSARFAISDSSFRASLYHCSPSITREHITTNLRSNRSKILDPTDPKILDPTDPKISDPTDFESTNILAHLVDFKTFFFFSADTGTGDRCAQNSRKEFEHGSFSPSRKWPTEPTLGKTRSQKLLLFYSQIICDGQTCILLELN